MVDGPAGRELSGLPPEPATSELAIYDEGDRLPIDPVLPALKAALRSQTTAVLQAPPGAGKTTRVPLALLDEPWLQGRRIIMLEPRRLAARTAAGYMAARLGERVGETVGYRIRRETRVGGQTRIEVVTEGVLPRMLQSDPALEAAGLVVFDEFHERSIQADAGLALTLQTKALLRQDLRVLVMSATLEGEPIARLLGGAPIVTSEGRSHPVETRHRPPPARARVESTVAAAVREALVQHPGDILVFLPGAGEIRRVAEILKAELPPASDPSFVPRRPSGTDIVPLHGNLAQDLQDRAFRPSPPGRRKVVLATSIAETSLTIEGVQVVIDSGLARVPRFSPRTGMTRLETVRVSRAAADQRRGRAGRLGPGVCYRLWPAYEDQQLIPRAPPEMLEADLAPLLLELAAAGTADPSDLSWIDPPPPAASARGRALLQQLGALDATGAITAHGRLMADLALHPRLAHMVLRGAELGLKGAACDLAALLSERDFLRSDGAAPDPDLRLRMELLAAPGTPALHQDSSVDREALHRVRAEARLIRMLAGGGPPARSGPSSPPSATTAAEATGLLLSLAYPDRIAQRRPGQAGRFLLSNGLGAFLDAPALATEPFLVAAELDGRQPESRILLAAPVTQAELEAQFEQQLNREDVIVWEEKSASVIARRRLRLGALVLREASLEDPDPELVCAALLNWVARQGIGVLPWDGEANRLRDRLRFLGRLDRSWPEVSDQALTESLSAWLGPHLRGKRRREDLRTLDLGEALLQRLGWTQRSQLEELAPTHLTVPSGSRLPIDYSDPDHPVLAVRLQEVFGMTETPTIGPGGIPLTLHLLSPAGRPVQVTRDLAGFWRTTYFDVRKDLRGRYPKHHWPDDPLRATPTSRPKKRGR